MADTGFEKIQASIVRQGELFDQMTQLCKDATALAKSSQHRLLVIAEYVESCGATGVVDTRWVADYARGLIEE